MNRRLFLNGCALNAKYLGNSQYNLSNVLSIFLKEGETRRRGLRKLEPMRLLPRLRRAGGLAAVPIALLQRVEDSDDESLLRFG